MNVRFYLFVTLSVWLVLSIIAAWIYYHLRAGKLYGRSWEAIRARVIPIDRGNLRIVALDLLGEADELDRRDGPVNLTRRKSWSSSAVSKDWRQFKETVRL